MTTRPDKLCMKPRCGEFATERGYCSQHVPADTRTARPLEHLYRRKHWLKLFRPRFLANNPICQRVINGDRCHEPAHQLHHLIEPRTVEQFYDWRNIIGLCPGHHAPWKGTPDWKINVDYAPTNWPALYVGEGG